jgi:hypothetical protein
MIKLACVVIKVVAQEKYERDAELASWRAIGARRQTYA